MSEYNQVRSFNLGIAQDTSIEAAMIYDDLAYAQKVFGRGHFYRSDEQMLKRFPVFSKSTIRRHVKKLVDGGWISTKVMKIDDATVLHYLVEKTLNVQKEQSGNGQNDQSLGNSQNDHSFNSKETKKETKIADALLIQLIDLVNPREKPTAERRRALAARLKDYKADEILQAARVFSKSEWHIENKQMSIDNLLAPSKFGRWYAQRDTEAADAAERIRTQDQRVRDRMGGGDVAN